MNELPDGWDTTELGDICKANYGKGLRKDLRNELGRFAVYGSAGVAGNHDESLVDGPVLIVGRKGNAGDVHFSERPCWPIDTTYYLAPPSEVEPKFLSMQLQHLRLGQLDSSTAIPSLRREDLEGARVVVPPLPEQRRIVAAIEKHFFRLDAAEAGLNRGSRRLRTLSDGAWLQAEESDWPRSRLSNVLLKRDGRVLRQGWSPRCLKTPSSDDDTWGVLKTSAVQFRSFDASANKELPPSLSPRPELEILDGDMVMTSGGPRSRIGVSCIARLPRPRLMLCDKMFRFRPDPTYLDPEFLLMHLTSPQGLRDIEKIKTGSNDSGLRISQGAFEDLVVPIPPLDAQAEIVQRSSEMSSQVEAAYGTIERLMRRSSALRRSILTAAFSGQLVPQDPSDEPASVLLVRIAAERAASKPSRKTKSGS